MEIHPKFIIQDGNLILGKVTFHKDLAKSPGNVTGGGWFRWNEEYKTIIFYGSSHDFGEASMEDIKQAVASKHVYEYRIGRKFRFANMFAYDNGKEITILS